MNKAIEKSVTNSRGRPRDPDIERRVLETTLRHFAANGYARMSVSAIATEAQVTKPSIYLRWPSKAALAVAAIAAIQEADPPPFTDDTYADLLAHLKTFRRTLQQVSMPLIGTLLAEEKHTPDLIALFRERVVKRRRQMLREVLVRARDRGEIRAHADIDIAVTMMIGSYYAEYLAEGTVERRWVERVVETVWDGLTEGRGEE